MLYITLEDGIKLVDPNDILDNWQNRLVIFSVLGFQRQRELHIYRFGEPTQTQQTLSDLLEFLDENEYEYELDQEIQKILHRIVLEREQYQDAINRVKPDATDTIIEFGDPPRMIRTLKPYQVKCVNHFLSVRHGANFSVPGSGKTTMMYGAYDILKSLEIVDKILVVGPISSFMAWEDEYEGCFGEKVSSARLVGTLESRVSKYINSDKYELFLVHFQTATNDLIELVNLCKRHKILLIIDESHYIKKLNEGVWSNAVLELAPYAERRAILTGTPMPNDYGDLWTQFTFLWTGEQVLGSREVYRERIKQEDKLSEIQKAIRPFFVRVRKTDLDLPEPNFEQVFCDLNRYQQYIYDALAMSLLQDLNLLPEERNQLRGWRKAKMIRLIQAASNPTLLNKFSEEFRVPPLSGSGANVLQLINNYPEYEVPAKIMKAIEIVRDLISTGEKVVLWTSFVLNIQMLQNLLKNVESYTIYGAIPRDEQENIEFNREQQINSFKQSQNPCVLIANPAACAESISLHRACRNAIYLDRTFNAGQYIQSLDRIHRIGTEATVNYYLLIGRNTIDSTIDKRIMEKQVAMQTLLEGDLPVGSFETPMYEMGISENDEKQDFSAVIHDLKQQYKQENQ